VQEANSSADQLHDDSGNGICAPEQEHLPCFRPGCGQVRKVDFLHGRGGPRLLRFRLQDSDR